jgi:hypothetical protein
LPKIIISYRRQDSQDMAMRIRDVLAPHYGEESVFTDVDSIPLGTDFLEHLNAELASCDAVIAVVGPRWLDGGHGPGHGVHEETDFVRIEVEAALNRKIPVIPALVPGAAMPKPAELPEALRRFAFRNGTAIDSGVNFRNDTNRLIRSLDETFAAKKQAPRDAPKPARENVPADDSPSRPSRADRPRPNSSEPTGSPFGALWKVLHLAAGRARPRPSRTPFFRGLDNRRSPAGQPAPFIVARGAAMEPKVPLTVYRRT